MGKEPGGDRYGWTIERQPTIMRVALVSRAWWTPRTDALIFFFRSIKTDRNQLETIKSEWPHLKSKTDDLTKGWIILKRCTLSSTTNQHSSPFIPDQKQDINNQDYPEEPCNNKGQPPKRKRKRWQKIAQIPNQVPNKLWEEARKNRRNHQAASTYHQSQRKLLKFFTCHE